MTTRTARALLIGALLTLGGCVVAPAGTGYYGGYYYPYYSGSAYSYGYPYYPRYRYSYYGGYPYGAYGYPGYYGPGVAVSVGGVWHGGHSGWHGGHGWHGGGGWHGGHH